MDAPSTWFTVRCLIRFEHGPGTENGPLYEERITLWKAASFDEAIARAESEAGTYASDVEGELVAFAQAFQLTAEGSLADGAEVFSLMRMSELAPEEYTDRYFDTGHERSGSVD